MPRKPTQKAAKPKSRKRVTVREVAKAMERIGVELTDRQKLFCTLYLSDRWCFSNATQSYAEAYQVNKTSKPQMNTARQQGYKLLTNPHIRAYIDKKLEEQLEEVAVDKELARVITQNRDLHAKNTGISEYNKLKNRVKSGFVNDKGEFLPVISLTINGLNPETTPTKKGN